MKRDLVARIVLLAALSATVAATALNSEPLPRATAGRCLCPKIYAPVICDNGKVYPNQCVADCRNARNCVPYGG